MTNFNFGRFLDYRFNAYRSSLNQYDRANSINFGGGVPPPLGTLKVKFENKSGASIPDDAGTVWHLIADNITGGGTWPSTVGGLTATGKVSGNTSETPFYPAGQFDGVNYRKATTQFTPAIAFTQTYAAPLDFTATNETNFVIIFRTGSFDRNETILSRYIAAQTNYNCRVWTTTAGELKFRVGCDAGDSVAVISNLDPYTYYYAYFYWKGSTLQTYINLNGTITNFATGVGNVINDNTTAWKIGVDAFVGTDYALTTQILEIWRSDTIVPSVSELRKMVRKFCGIQPTTGPDPTSCFRTSSAEVLVNSKLWRFGPNLMRMSFLGTLIQDTQVGQLLNSTFTASLNPATDWVTVTNGTTSVFRANNIPSYQAIGGQAVRFDVDALGSRGAIYQTSSSNFSNGDKIWISFDYRSITGSGTPYWSMQNAATLDWYNATTNTWGGVEVFNPATPSGTTLRHSASFTMNANGQLNYNISSGASGDNVSQSFEIYHTQIDVGEQLLERIVSRDSYKTKDQDIVVFAVNDLFNRYNGAITFSCSLSSPGTDSLSTNRSVIGGGSPVVGILSGQKKMMFRDVTNNQVVGSEAYSRLESDDYTLIYDWNIPSSQMKSVALGVNSTNAAFVGVAISDFGFGQNGGAATGFLEGYIKNLTTYDP